MQLRRKLRIRLIANNVDSDPYSQPLPGLVRRVDWGGQRKPYRQARPVAERQAKGAPLGNQAAGDFRLLCSKGYGFADRARSGFPGFVRSESPACELAVHLCQIDGAADGAAEQLRRQPVRARLTVQHREERGASSTTLFIPGCFAPFGDQLVNQRGPRPDVLADKAPGALPAAFQRGDPQFIIFDPQKDLVADADTKRLAIGRRNHHATVFVDTQARLCVRWDGIRRARR